MRYSPRPIRRTNSARSSALSAVCTVGVDGSECLRW